MEAALRRRELLLLLLLPPLATALLGPAAPLQLGQIIGWLQETSAWIDYFTGEGSNLPYIHDLTCGEREGIRNDHYLFIDPSSQKFTISLHCTSPHCDRCCRAVLEQNDIHSWQKCHPLYSCTSEDLCSLIGLYCAKYCLCQEMIRVNVMMLKSSGEFHKGQVVFNISYVNGQVYLNDFPMKSGVTHITCQTIILEDGNWDNSPDQQRLGTVSVRIMVHEWPLASSSDLQLIVIQEEVTEIDGKQVQQEEVTEIDILVKDLRVLRHSNYTVPLKESMLYSIPRDNDMLFTLPNLSGKDIQDPLQTTSQYLIQQVETTVDEETLPGKLPETPLRIEPPSSYKVMCQWVEDLRKGLCRFWIRSFPIFFSFMEVIVVGVVGAALILKILKVIFPSCENKGILLLDQASFVPVITISLPSDHPDRKNNLDEKTCT